MDTRDKARLLALRECRRRRYAWLTLRPAGVRCIHGTPPLLLLPGLPTSASKCAGLSERESPRHGYVRQLIVGSLVQRSARSDLATTRRRATHVRPSVLVVVVVVEGCFCTTRPPPPPLPLLRVRCVLKLRRLAREVLQSAGLYVCR